MFSDDLVMKIGNQFRVLERTKYGILIEEICDNNTYFVVINLLREVSGIHFHRTRYPCQEKKRRLYSHPEVCWITRQRRN